MKKQHSDKNEIYSISGFRDTLASPVFYPVVVVAIVLGITSMFGFVQNPEKLKSMVDVMHQKVATTNVVNGTVNDQLYRVSQTNKSSETPKLNSHNTSLKLFTDIDANLMTYNEKMPVHKDIERIAFNYDVTSESFWTELDSSKLESAREEMERKQREAGTIGAPLEINNEKFPAKFKLNDESIYALSHTKDI